MRTLALLLALLAVPVLALPAHAEDDDAEVGRLERRVEMLIDLVAELRAQVLALEARVAELEALQAEAEPTETEAPVATPKGEVIPAIPIVPVPVVAWPQVGGLYALDKEATVAAIVDSQLEGVEDEEMTELIRQGVAAEFEGVSITLRIEENGSFFVRLEGTSEDDEGATARGTWKRDVTVIGRRQRLLFLTTHEDGVEDPSPKELVGTWEEGRLVLAEGDEEAGGGGYVMVFRRK